VGSTPRRRALAPPAAERARSIALRGGTATLVGTACPEPVTPLVHHVRADGSAVLLLADDEPLLDHAVLPAGGPLARARTPEELHVQMNRLVGVSPNPNPSPAPPCPRAPGA
jgi:hypothetical protein